MGFPSAPSQDLFPSPPKFTDLQQGREELPRMIQGHRATRIEARVALALERLGFEYQFQVSFFGGRDRVGGTVVDFLVSTFPEKTPILVQGEYWHKGNRRTLDAIIEARLRYRTGIGPPVILYGQELQTMEQTMAVLRRHLR